jgi:hypothetical protein
MIRRKYSANVRKSAIAFESRLLFEVLEQRVALSIAPVVGGFDIARAGVTSLDSEGTQPLRDSISAAFPGTIFTSSNELTSSYLETIDVLMISSVSSALSAPPPLSSLEQQALLNFVNGGGGVIIFTDNSNFAGDGSDAINESFLDPFGLDTTGSTIEVHQLDVTDFTHHVTNGPYGAATAGFYAAPGWFDNLGPNAVSLGLVQGGLSGIAAINPGALSPSSGGVVFFSDAAPFAFAFSKLDNAILVLNAVAFAGLNNSPPSQLSGHVFVDSDNDGEFESSETGIAGQIVTLSGTDANGPVSRVEITDSDGSYLFADVRPGSYTIVAEQLIGLLDGNESAGTLGGTVNNSADNNTISGIVIGTDGVEATDYNFADIRPSDLQGLVWQDFNNDGTVNFGEKAIEDVAIELTGTDDRGNPVNVSPDTTDSDGIYMFIDLRPGEYKLTESQRASFIDGLDVIGTVNDLPDGDNSVNDMISAITLSLPGSTAENYNFGERPPAGGGVTGGQTATIGFWQNNNGQALIESLNGGAGSTQLASWLAATLPNMYGASAGTNNVSGRTNAQVADFYSDLFRRKKKEAEQLGLGGPVKVDAQIMAVALATYVTNQTLAGMTAASFGFLVSSNGVGTATFNVGNGGEAFDVADNTTLAVLDLLFATNTKSWNGVLYDVDNDGDADDSWETTLRTLANDVYSAINESGDI